MPGWLLELVRHQREHTAPLKPVDPVNATTYGRAALRHATDRLAGAVEGTRNATHKESWGLGKLVATGALDANEVTSALMATALSIGLGERESERTIASGLTAGMAQPAGVEL